MVSVPEVPVYDPGVYQLEVTDPVQGGVSGIANQPSRNLANRTTYLKQRLDALVNGTIIPPTVAPLNGAAFTGSTTAPNVRPGDDSTLIANTDFVQTAKAGMVVVPVGGNTSRTLTQDQWGVGIIVFTGVLTGPVTVYFPAKTGAWIIANNTTGAQVNGAPWPLTCQTIAGTGLVVPPSPGQYDSIWCDGANIHPQVSPYALNLTNPLVIAALGFTPVQQGGGSNQMDNKLYIGSNSSSNSHIRVQVDQFDLGDITMQRDFTNLVGGTVPNTWIYFKSAGGAVIQCYQGNSGTGADLITFPQAFPTACVQVIASEGNPIGWHGDPNFPFTTVFGTQQLTRTNFMLYVNAYENGTWSLSGGIAYRYIAIGY